MTPYRRRAEAAFGVFFDEAIQEAAEIDGGFLGPGARGEGVDGGGQHFFSDGAGFGRDAEVGEESGEAHGPEGEVGDSGEGVAALAQVVEDGGEQAEVAFVGFVGRQQLLGDLGQVIKRDARLVVGRERELRVDQLAGVEADQFAVFLLKIRDGGVGEAFEGGAEVGFGTAGAAGDAAEFALVAGEEADDEVGFAEGVSLEDEGFARASGHGYRDLL